MRAGRCSQASGLLEPRLATATSGSLSSSTRPAAAAGGSIEAALTGGTDSGAFVLRTSAERGGLPVELRMIFREIASDSFRWLREGWTDAGAPWATYPGRSHTPAARRWQGASGSGESLQCGARRRSSAGRALHS